jgi:hypothetical protein
MRVVEGRRAIPVLADHADDVAVVTFATPVPAPGDITFCPATSDNRAVRTSPPVTQRIPGFATGGLRRKLSLRGGQFVIYRPTSGQCDKWEIPAELPAPTLRRSH